MSGFVGRGETTVQADLQDALDALADAYDQWLTGLPWVEEVEWGRARSIAIAHLSQVHSRLNQVSTLLLCLNHADLATLLSEAFSQVKKAAAAINDFVQLWTAAEVREWLHCDAHEMSFTRVDAPVDELIEQARTIAIEASGDPGEELAERFSHAALWLSFNLRQHVSGEDRLFVLVREAIEKLLSPCLLRVEIKSSICDMCIGRTYGRLWLGWEYFVRSLGEHKIEAPSRFMTVFNQVQAAAMARCNCRHGPASDSYYSPAEQATQLGVGGEYQASFRAKRAARFRVRAREAGMTLRSRPSGIGSGKGDYVLKADFDRAVAAVRSFPGRFPMESFLTMFLAFRWRCVDPNCANITDSATRPTWCPKCQRAAVVRVREPRSDRP